MPEQKIVFQNFARGEWGLQSPYNVGFGLYRGHLLYQGWFSGNNVMRYTNGMIGPRNEPIGTTFQLASGTNGPVLLTGGLDTIGTPHAVMVIWESGAPCQVFHGVLTGSPVIPQVWQGLGNMANGTPGDMFTGYCPTFPNVYLGHATGGAQDGIYSANLDNGTLALLSGSPGASAICQYQSFLMAGGTLNGLGNQLWYSAPANFSAWPALNFINIGPPIGIISGLFSLRNMLIITKTDGTYWALTGTPGVNEVLRQIETAAPMVPNTGTVVAGSTIAGNVSSRTGFRNVVAVPSTSGIMAQFDGRHLVPQRWLQLPNDTAILPAKALPLHDDGDWAMGCDNSGNLRVHRGGTWTTQNFNNVSPVFTSWLPQPDGRLIMMNLAGTSVLTWDPYNQRPPIVGDPQSGVPTPVPSGNSFQLPEWWDRTGVDCAVRYVLLDFTKWNTGLSTANTLTMTLNSLRPPGMIANANAVPGPVTGGVVRSDMTQVFNFSEATTVVPGPVGSSQQQRVNILFEEKQANGFQIGFTNLQGVAIEKLVVGLDTFAVRGR